MKALIRLAAVQSLTGISKSEIYRRLSRGEFPLPLRLGVRSIAWNADEISEWVDRQLRTAPRAAYRKPADSTAGSKP